MSTYFTSDLHLGHKNIHKFRSFVSSPEHNEDLICSAWSNIITKRDDVYVLGDAAFTLEGLDKLKNLPGRKFLIRGNHDKLNTSIYLKVFNEVFGLVKYKEFWLSHAPLHPEELRGRVNLHGHVHYSTLEDTRYFNCCIENLIILWNKPLVELEILRKYIANKNT